jgi:hypothetical protein
MPAAVRPDAGVQRGAMEAEGVQAPRNARRTVSMQLYPTIGRACGSYNSNAPALHGRPRTRLALPSWSRSSDNAGQYHSSVRFLCSFALEAGVKVGLWVNVTDDLRRNVKPDHLRKSAFNDLCQRGSALVRAKALAAEPARERHRRQYRMGLVGRVNRVALFNVVVTTHHVRHGPTKPSAQAQNSAKSSCPNWLPRENRFGSFLRALG